ncbi:MAG: hypothetical protein FWD47_15730 [Treponema sp.]|nr:hypothetical protein [Treponema sp.]
MKKYFLFLLCLLLIFSCDKGDHINGSAEMYILVSDSHRSKLFLKKINGNKIIDEKQLIDLTEIRRHNRIFQAGFFEDDLIFFIYEGYSEKITEKSVYLRIYNIINNSWTDVCIFNDIIIMDIENRGVYFSEYIRRNKLMFFDFNNQTTNTIFEYSENEIIISINCQFNKNIIAINTYENNKYRYYFIDKQTYEIITEGFGQIFINKYSDYIIKKNESSIYLLDDLFDPIIKIEIPIKKNHVFHKVIDVNISNFIIFSIKKRPIYLYNFLFGGEHYKEYYYYQLVRINKNNEFNLVNVKIHNLSNISNNQILFDAILKSD